MDAHVIREEVAGAKSHVIRPAFIDASHHFFEAFDNMEAEASARWIVEVCKSKGGWVSFSDDDLRDYSRNRASTKGVGFRRLLDKHYVLPLDNGEYAVTHEFICTCFKYSPAKLLFDIDS